MHGLQALDHLLVSALGWMPDPRASSARHLALTGLLFAGSLGLALLVTDLGVVFQLVGGTAGVDGLPQAHAHQACSAPH